MSWTYWPYKLAEVRFKLLSEVSQLYIMHIIFKTEKHEDIQIH